MFTQSTDLLVRLHPERDSYYGYVIRKQFIASAILTNAQDSLKLFLLNSFSMLIVLHAE